MKNIAARVTAIIDARNFDILFHILFLKLWYKPMQNKKKKFP